MPSIGRSLSLSDSQIETFSQISPIDLEAARSLWVSSVPARYKSLLDAQTIIPGARLSSSFVWDASSRRYIDLRRRRYIPYMEIRNRAIEPLIRSAKSAQRSLASVLQEGGALSDWQRGMISQIKTTQISAGLAANGGSSSTNEDDKKKIAEAILLFLLLLRGFAFDLSKGKTPLNGLLFIRSDLYASAARDTFEEIRRYGMATYFGAVEEKRVLGRAEHCHSDEDLEGCIELADLGYQPIGSLPRLGATPCRSNCQCHFDYRYKDERGEWVEVDDSATVATILSQLHIKESIDE